MNNPWVIDASPIILLAKIDHLKCLYKAPQNLIVLQEVFDEIMAGKEEDPARVWIQSEPEAYTVTAEPTQSIISSRQLGTGEAAVLSWAYNHPESTAIIDDLAARHVANSNGINFIGTLGVLLAAKNRGIISEVSSPIAQLLNKSLWLGEGIIREARRLAGEK